MLQTETQSSDPESIKKDSMSSSTAKTTTPDAPSEKDAKKTEAAKTFEWEEVKKARNRINSQRIRERERAQIANLEAERARLWLSNDAIQFQNRHFREVIAKILQVRENKRNRAAMTGGMRGAGAPGPSSALLGGAGMLGMRQDMMGGLAGGLDTTGLFQNPRLTAAAATSKSLSGLSDADLLARHQATSLEVQNMMRHQEAMDRFGAAGGMGGLGLNNGMANGMNNGMNMNMNMNAKAASPYADIAENIRIRQLMLQQSAGAPSDGLLSNPLVNGGGGNVGNANANALSLGGGALVPGDLGTGGGIGDVDLFQMSKRQKLGF